MEVGNGQQVRGQFVDPSGSLDALTFWAVTVTAGVVKDPNMTAFIAFINVSTHDGSSTVLKGIKYFHLPGRHSVVLSEGLA